MTLTEYKSEVKRLAEKYRKYGFTEEKIEHVIAVSMEKPDPLLDLQSIMTGVKLGLSHEYGEKDLFTREEIKHALGLTDEELDKEMADIGVEQYSVSLAPWLRGGLN